MIPLDDIHSQILDAVQPYIGILPAEIAAPVYGYLCSYIVAVPGVASVAIHSDEATGAVDASVEVADGEVFTVTITEAAADPIDALTRELADAIGSGHGGLSFVKRGTLRSIVNGIAHIVHERDLKIATLEASLTNTKAFFSAQAVSLEARIAGLEAVIAGLQSQITSFEVEASFSHQMACADTRTSIAFPEARLASIGA